MVPRKEAENGEFPCFLLFAVNSAFSYKIIITGFAKHALCEPWQIFQSLLLFVLSIRKKGLFHVIGFFLKLLKMKNNQGWIILIYLLPRKRNFYSIMGSTF